ncbi:MAG: GNAT family N-acetyltransferase [Thaumarchaeota archaeon]|nr:GNAT family N-acetyltransferase [Nitrososphaerota archaeon]
MAYTTKELGAETFPDFEELAVKQGDCWCIYYQRPKPVTRGMSPQERSDRNRRDKRRLVGEGRSHAILVYDGQRPVGWCQYGAYDELPRIDAGRFYKKIGRPEGERNLWRITCFFVDRQYRGKGVSKAGLKAALQSIAKRGGGVVEAYPVVSTKMAAVPEWRWFGVPSMFEREGFSKVSNLGTSLTLMRKTVNPKK